MPIIPITTMWRVGELKSVTRLVCRFVSPEIHPAIAHLASLLGTWRGRGSGHYPTIDPFEYVEEVTIGHVGKPFLSYTQKTRHAETDLPLHAEAGYFRPVGLEAVELILAQPSGIVEIDEGSVAIDEGVIRIDITSQVVATSSTAKDVASVRRTLSIAGDELRYDVEMGAVGQTHQHHLNAVLTRVTTP